MVRMTVRLESANLSKCLSRSRDAVASRPVTMNLLSVIFYTLISALLPVADLCNIQIVRLYYTK